MFGKIVEFCGFNFCDSSPLWPATWACELIFEGLNCGVTREKGNFDAFIRFEKAAKITRKRNNMRKPFFLIFIL